jgi:hypothetical protein
MFRERVLVLMTVVFVVLGVCGSTWADVNLFPTSDARGHRVWYSGGNFYSVESADSTTLAAARDTSGWNFSDRWWDVPIIEFPIASLSGLEDIEATLSIYFESVTTSVSIRYGSDDNGVIEAGDWLNFGTDVVSLDGTTTGWVQQDVSNEIQSLVDLGHDWAVFTVCPTGDWYGATIRASEYADYSPQLGIATPEPGTLTLLALGGLAMLRRLRNDRGPQ